MLWARDVTAVAESDLLWVSQRFTIWLACGPQRLPVRCTVLILRLDSDNSQTVLAFTYFHNLNICPQTVVALSKKTKNLPRRIGPCQTHQSSSRSLGNFSNMSYILSPFVLLRSKSSRFFVMIIPFDSDVVLRVWNVSLHLSPEFPSRQSPCRWISL